jgi:hypothetical protein
MTRMLSRRDRAACQLALECLRAAPRGEGWDHATSALEHGDRAGPPLSRALDCTASEYGHRRVGRLLTARLALYVRALLRADRGDYGPTEWLGCTCSCDGDRGGWAPRRITPLWELAPAHEGRR